MDVTHLREEYRKEALGRDSLRPDPLDQFSAWFQQAREAQLREPNAMILATVERNRLWTALRETALVDELTGLYNRRGFLTLARQQLRLR